MKIKTPHGTLETPFFMPDATRGLVKGFSGDDLKKTAIKAAVVNTYHLFLQPGDEVIKKAGGIHKFGGFSGPILSDSGGYQVFSLIHKHKDMGKILDDKVIFRSPLDGRQHEITPEKSIQIQFNLGVDMMVCLDDCPPNDCSREKLLSAVSRTIAWAKRCKKEHERQIKKRKLTKDKQPLLFAVIQGGLDMELRRHCALELAKIGFDGYGFGARHIDENNKFLTEVMRETAASIPSNALKFALGVGSPDDIVRSYDLGWQMFDCVMPTREGRHGKLFFFVKNKKIEAGKKFFISENFSNAKFARDFKAINPESKIPELKNYSRAFLHHLFKINDPLAGRLASLNNLEFYKLLMDKLRSR